MGSVALPAAILLKPKALRPPIVCRAVYEMEISDVGFEYSALLSGSRNPIEYSTAPGHGAFTQKQLPLSLQMDTVVIFGQTSDKSHCFSTIEVQAIQAATKTLRE
jgi:hypothetical protein